jgi:hypothetical protein
VDALVDDKPREPVVVEAEPELEKVHGNVEQERYI